MNTSGKICPTCKYENADTASVCLNCGARLEDNPTKLVSIPENLGELVNAAVEQMASFIDIALIPEDGIGIYVAGTFKAFYVEIYKELIIGRPVDATMEAILDLSDLNAANLGVSKRHAMIRRTASGFEVLDLASRNGSWLNAQRLAPNKPYLLASGSQLRLGQMRLLVMYKSPA